MSEPCGLLFDLDGTMLDTDPLHFAAFQTLLAPYGKSITEHYYNTQIMGYPIDDIMRGLFPDASAAQRHELGEEKEALFRQQLKGPLVGKPGLRDVMDWARGHSVGICVVTNAPRANAEMMLEGLGVRGYIDHLLIGLELPRMKPDPYPYLEGLRRLGATVARAFAFEDSGPGVRSAAGAGLHTFGLRGVLGPEELRQNGARDVLDDYTEAHLWAKLHEIAPHASGRVA